MVNKEKQSLTEHKDEGRETPEEQEMGPEDRVETVEDLESMVEARSNDVEAKKEEVLARGDGLIEESVKSSSGSVSDIHSGQQATVDQKEAISSLALQTKQKLISLLKRARIFFASRKQLAGESALVKGREVGTDDALSIEKVDLRGTSITELGEKLDDILENKRATADGEQLDKLDNLQPEIARLCTELEKIISELSTGSSEDSQRDLLIALANCYNRLEDIDKEYFKLGGEFSPIPSKEELGLCLKEGRLPEADCFLDNKERGNIGRLIAEIGKRIDELDLSEVANQADFQDLERFLREVAMKRAGYGGAAEYLGKKLTDKAENIIKIIQQRINSEGFDKVIEFLKEKRIIEGVAYALPAALVGCVSFGGPNLLDAETEVKLGPSDKDVVLEMGGESIKIIGLKEFAEEVLDGAGEDLPKGPEQKIDRIFTDFEYQGSDINYEINDPEVFKGFILDEIERIMADKGIDCDLGELNPMHVIFFANMIVQEHLEYDYLAIEDTDEGSEENKKISEMPIDEMLMNYHKGVCRHYAALVEAVSDLIIEESGSPLLENFKIEDSSAPRTPHAWNVAMFKTTDDAGKPLLLMVNLDATADDSTHEFADGLEAIREKWESGVELMALFEGLAEDKRGEEVGAYKHFSINEQLKVFEAIVNNIDPESPAAITANRLLADYYLRQANFLSLKDEGRVDMLGKEDQEKIEGFYNSAREHSLASGFKTDSQGDNSYLRGSEYKDATLELVEFYQQTGQEEKLVEFWQEAYRDLFTCHGERVVVASDAAEFFFENNNYEEALRWSKLASSDERYFGETEEDPDSGRNFLKRSYLFTLAVYVELDIYEAEQSYDSAIEALKGYITVPGSHQDNFITMLINFCEKADRDFSEVYEDIMAIVPDLPQEDQESVNDSLAYNFYEKAIDQRREYLEKVRDELKSDEGSGEISPEDADQAVEALLKAKEHALQAGDDENYMAKLSILQLAKVYEDVGNIEAAIQALEELPDHGITDISANMELASLYEIAGEIEKAIEVYNQSYQDSLAAGSSEQTIYKMDGQEEQREELNESYYFMESFENLLRLYHSNGQTEELNKLVENALATDLPSYNASMLLSELTEADRRNNEASRDQSIILNNLDKVKEMISSLAPEDRSWILGNLSIEFVHSPHINLEDVEYIKSLVEESQGDFTKEKFQEINTRLERLEKQLKEQKE